MSLPVTYLESRQCRSKFVGAFVGNVRVVDVKLLQIRKPLKMSQPGICNVRVVQIDDSKLGKALEMNHSGIRDLRVNELK